MLSHDELLRALNYDLRSGHFKWRTPGRKRRVGATAGAINKGRRYTSIDYKTYLASCLALTLKEVSND